MQQRLADLERRVALADDHDALAAIPPWRSLHVHVVLSDLEAGDRRYPRLRRADGEHHDAAPIGAVGRGDVNMLAVEPGRFPGAAVADVDRRSFRERLKPRLHLLPCRPPATLTELRRDQASQLR